MQQLEIDDGNTIQVVDIDRNKPFAIVLPINAGNITFYDVNEKPNPPAMLGRME